MLPVQTYALQRDWPVCSSVLSVLKRLSLLLCLLIASSDLFGQYVENPLEAESNRNESRVMRTVFKRNRLPGFIDVRHEFVRVTVSNCSLFSPKTFIDSSDSTVIMQAWHALYVENKSVSLFARYGCTFPVCYVLTGIINPVFLLVPLPALALSYATLGLEAFLCDQVFFGKKTLRFTFFLKNGRTLKMKVRNNALLYSIFNKYPLINELDRSLPIDAGAK
jgi:hypothetical protein